MMDEVAIVSAMENQRSVITTSKFRHTTQCQGEFFKNTFSNKFQPGMGRFR